jgi:RHS repeat-associated protein
MPAKEWIAYTFLAFLRQAQCLGTPSELLAQPYDGSDWLITANLGAPNLTANTATLQDTYENWDYGYDNAGNQLSSAVNLAGWAGQYDGANELTQQRRTGPVRVAGFTNEPTNVTVGGAGTRRWSLPGGSPWMFESILDLGANTSNVSIVATDAAGNSTTQVWKIDANSTVSNFTYNADGAMLSRVNNADSSTVQTTSNCTWDALGRLLSWQNGNTTVSFTYDWQGRRVSLSANVSGNTTTQNFLWDGDSIVERRDAGTGSGNISRKYFDDGVVTVSGNTSTNYFYTKDHLGSIRELVANDGHTVEGRYDYGPWGETNYFDYSGGTIPEPDVGYAGYFITPFVPGAEMAMERIYGPDIHRWWSRDPSGEHGGLNMDSYAMNDPIDEMDPLGLKIARAGTGVPTRGASEHTSYLTFTISCPKCEKVANVVVHYPGLQNALHNLNPVRDWVLGPTDPSNTTARNAPDIARQSNCDGNPVTVQTYMETRYAGSIFGNKESVDDYVNYTFISYDCVPCSSE